MVLLILSTALLMCTLSEYLRAWHAGTTRLQLENKGDSRHQYIDFANIIVAFAFLTIPLIGWLLDKKVRILCTHVSSRLGSLHRITHTCALVDCPLASMNHICRAMG